MVWLQCLSPNGLAPMFVTKWFGFSVCHIAGAVVLTSDRNLSPSNEPMQRGEGVALVLCGDGCISIWEAVGKQWRSWSGSSLF